ncbi:hypothetical protein RJ640_020540, partial [Escallonia rubra]
VFATPETLIGFHPDNGAPFYLSYLPGHLGLFEFNGAEMVACGLATHYSLCANLPLLEQQLGELVTDDPSVIETSLEKNLPLLEQQLGELVTDDPSVIETSLEKYGDLVYPDNMSVVRRYAFDFTESEATKTDDAWCISTLKRLKDAASPLSLKVSLRSIREGRFQTLDQCLIREYRMSMHSISEQISTDFSEGVRSRLVDKDYAPKWNPPTLDQVSNDMVDQYFSPLGAVEPDLHLPKKQRAAFMKRRTGDNSGGGWSVCLWWVEMATALDEDLAKVTRWLQQRRQVVRVAAGRGEPKRVAAKAESGQATVTTMVTEQ